MSNFYIENLGCAKNQVDAELIIATLKDRGWVYCADKPEDADLIIVNTCGFIKSAQEEAVDTLLRAKKDYPGKKIVAAGCLAQRWADTLPHLIPEIDGVFGNRAPERAGEAVDDVLAGKRPVFTPEAGSSGTLRRDFFGFKRSVYLKIADGCNHRCRFCAIPLIKGPLVSRRVDDVVNEARALLDDGAFEINLVAQDLSSFGSDGRNLKEGKLLELLKALVCTLPADQPFWLRLLYLHPDVFPFEILDVMTDEQRIIPYFDIPFQHASAAVLRKMGRSGDASSYLKLIRTIRHRLPDAVIRSTFLVGHPGEGKKEFEDLLRFQDEAQLDWLGVFAWSREEGTAAARDRGALASRILAPWAEKRRYRIEAHQKAITESRMARWIGRSLPVLIEEKVKDENLAIGRTFFQAPEVDGNTVVHSGEADAGDVVNTQLYQVTGIDIQARPQSSSDE